MQPAIWQELMTARVADLQRQAEIARLARELKRGRRRAHRAPVPPVRAAQPTGRPEHARLGAV
jgi:hypothetical protein